MINGTTIYPPDFESPTCSEFTAPNTFMTSFAGGQIMVDGTTWGSPQELLLTMGSHGIEAPSLQIASGLVYSFSSWSDGGARSHSVSVNVDQGAQTCVANFSITKPIQVAVTSVGGRYAP